MSARRRLFSLLASVFLIVPTLVAIPVAALAQVSYQLNVSTNSDRSGAIPLDGAVVSGDMFAFTSPDDSVDTVTFWVNDPSGTPFRTEFDPPFDLAGGLPDNAAPYDTTILPDGVNTIYAELGFDDGSSTVISSAFTVANSAPSLQFSDSSFTFDMDLGDPVASDSTTLSTTSSTAGFTLTVVQNPEGSSWLSVDPLAGSTPDSIDLDVDPSGLAPGVYNATVIASAPGYIGDSLGVTLNLTDPSVTPGLRLVVSTSPARSGPVDLDGAVVMGDAFVFVSDETGTPFPSAPITQVRYFTNGSGPTKVENFEPWDYLGGPVSNPVEWDTTGEADGPFQISAEVDVTGSGTEILVADFVIQNSGPPVPLVDLSPGSVDFGEIISGGSDIETVTLSNVGSASLSIAGISVTGSGFALDGENCPASLAPTASCQIDVEFAPIGPGSASGSLTVTSNATSSPDVVPLAGSSADPNPALSLAPLLVDFGDVVVGDSASAQVILTSTGNVPVDLTTMGTDSSDMVMTGDTCPASVNPGASCAISLEFNPGAVTTYNATLSVVSNAASSPDTVPLTGDGIEEPEEGLRLVVSTSPTRSGPVNLDGAVVMGDAFVFVSDETGTPSPSAPITQVRYFTNGAGPTQVENFEPWDYEGGPVSNPAPFDTTGEADGPFQISAEVDVAGSGTEILVADFVIQNTVPLPVISVSPTLIDFGQVDVGDTGGPVTVTVENIGTADLNVTDISTSAPFGETSTCGVVAAGGSCTVDVTFAPTAAGPAADDLTITSDAANGPTTTVPLSGEGYEPAPVVDLDPLSLVFPMTDVGDTAAAQQVTLTNTGDADLTITSIGATNGDFGVTESCPGTLAPSDSCTIDVDFTPSIDGPINGGLDIVTNAASSPDTVALSGEGNVPAPAVDLDPLSLVFPLTNVGDTSAMQSVTLTNSGDADLIISNWYATNLDFGIYNAACPGTLAPGASCVFDVDFTASAAGPVSADVVVETNAASSPDSVAVSGEGFEAEELTLVYSLSSDRSAPMPLEGAVLSGDVWIFVDPAFPTTPINTVEYSFDGFVTQIESIAPYDFEGGPVSSPVAFDTTTEDEGDHNISADVNLTAGGVLVLTADFEIDNSQGSALVGITPGGGLGASTFDGDAFQITNTGDVNIEQVEIDLSNSFLPDMVFDPVGGAGDNLAKCVEPNGGLSDNVGYVTPGDPCVTPFSGGSASDGYSTVTLDFTGFGPGETFVFSTDVDPTTIKGYGGAGNAGAISGLELMGATVTVTFADGVESHQTFGDGSAGGATAQVPSDVAGTPTLSVSGVALAPTTLSNGADAATVTTPAQTILLAGPANSNVTLIHVNGDLEDAPTGGFNDLEAYEINEADVVDYIYVALDGSGSGSAAVTLLDGMNYFRAAVLNGDQGLNSNVVILELGAEPGVSTATVSITPGGGVGASTFSNDAFQIDNGSGSNPILSVEIDLANSFLPDMVFDPVGTAGDDTAKCLEPNGSLSDPVGYVVPGNNCVDPFSNGTGADGYSTVTLNFTDFDAGETFVFSTDVDPTTIKGFSAAGNAGAISGLELAGSMTTITFDDGTVAHEIFGDGTAGGASGVVPTSVAGTPTLDALGVTLTPTTLSNGATAASVLDAAQTIAVTGPANADVTLIHVNGDLEDAPAGGFNDLEAYEINEADVVDYVNVSLDGSGSGSAGITLLSGMNYFRAAVSVAGETGLNSNVVILNLGPEPGVPSATLEITPGGGIGASTFDADSFTITNTGTDPITSAEIDLATAFFPDVVFDPLGLAGDDTAGCLVPHASSDDVGFVTPGDPCADPFSDGNATDGYTLATLGFTDFEPGESFVFTADVDPTTIKGFASAGNAGAISGLELAGTTFSVNSAAGSSISQIYGDGSAGGSHGISPAAVATTIGLDVDGLTLGSTGFSNGALGAFVTDAAQTAVISGPAGAAVTLIVADANLEDAPPGGFNDLDPLERNKAQTVTYLAATIGPGGTVDVPFSVSTVPGEATYLMAAADDTAYHGAPTVPVYLDLTDAPPPAGEVVYRVNNGGPLLPALDGGPAWEADQSVADAAGAATTGTPSPYLSPAYTEDNTFGDIDETITTDATVPSYVPIELFTMERWDPDSNGEMTFEFPVSSGVEYEVRLYFAEIWDEIGAQGPRVFSVDVEGTTYGPIDIAAEVGTDTGTMKSYSATVADDSLTVTFLHGMQNPAVKGIEVLVSGEGVSGDLPMTTDTEADGATPADPVETTVDPPSAGGPYSGSLSEGPITEPTPSGFELFGQQVSIVVTPDSPGAGDPFGVVFELDASILPVDPGDVEVFKDGTLVADCPGDPCESSRVVLGNGNLQIAIETTTFSEWTFGFVPPVNLDADMAAIDFADVPVGTAPTIDVTFTHTGAVGAPQITVDPVDITIAGDGELSIAAAPATTQVLDAGDSFVVTVEYAPTVAPAAHSATLSVVHDGDNDPTEVAVTANTVAGPMPGDVLFRVNAGGALVAAIDGGPDWDADTSGAPHANLADSGSNNTAGFPSVEPGPTVPASTPGVIFDTERWDNSGGSEMQWEFPVPAGTLVEVRLYVGNGYPGTSSPGQRVYDIEIDGVVIFDDLDLSDEFGHEVGAMLSYETVSDGVVDIDFIHGVENPLVNGIELVVAGPQPNVLGVSPAAVNFGTVVAGSSTTQTVTLTNLGDAAGPDPTITINSLTVAGGAPFSITDQPTLPFDLLPGGSTTVDVTYDPPVVDGNLDTLQIGSTASNDPVDVPLQGTAVSDIPVSFGSDGLAGESLSNPTSLDFGPDGRLYVTQQNGMVYAYTISRDGAPAGSGSYTVTDTEPIDLIKNIPNHNDDGSLNTSQTNRQVTGILATGTAANPVLFVTSSDPRIGAGGSGTDSNLDTNSGIISKLTWNGASWDKIDVVRGLPRSEENHATNGMALTPDGNTLYVMSGGHTNQGAPSNNFAETPEYALSAAMLKVDLAMIDSTYGGSYDLPTVGRAAGAEPFGGNDGATQAVWDVDGPVQVYSPGYRNAYDVVLTLDGNLYTFDNGPNNGWGGIPPSCDNTTTESGSETAPDNLHHVSGEGYYGGHPNPTRGNLSLVPGAVVGTPPYDTSVECNYLSSSGSLPPADGSLATVNSSTNGMTEYTASNFGGAMQGDLLAAAFNGNIYRMKPTAAGDALVNLTGDPNNPEQSLFSGFGSTPLDVTAQGDGDIFPGTVWAATYGSDNITVFEPADFGTTCTGAYDAGLDEDGDGYNNADEIDNGTDPCNGGSQPNDWDGDFISDLNDDDDDDDLVLDVNDAFALDPNNGLVTTAPLLYPLDLNSVGASEVPPFGTFKNVGFTGLMLDPSGTTDYLTQFDEGNLNVGGATGVFSVDVSSTGDPTNNDQDNAFQFGVDPASLAGPFTVHVQTVQPFPTGVTPTNYQSVGFYIGNGDQDNYLKLVVSANGSGGGGTAGAGGFQLGGEQGGPFATAAQPDEPGVVGDGVDIDLYMAVDPTVVGDPAVDAFYRLNGGPLTAIGSTTIPAAWLAGPDAFAVGLISTSFGATPITPAWELVEITLGAPDTTAPAAPTNLVATGSDGQVSLDWDDNAEDDLDVYSIYRSTTSPVDTSGTPIAQPAGSNYIDTLVTNGTMYYYVVTARDTSLNESAPSNEDDATPMAPAGAALFRINVGGPEVAADDASTPPWAADTDANPSSFRTNGADTYTASSGGAHPGPIDMSDPSIPASAPVAVFETERYDTGSSGDPLADEMQWDFPITGGTEVEVTLLFAELYSGVDDPGERVFDVQIEGGTPAIFSGVDQIATAGPKGAFALSTVVAVSADGNLDIDFIHDVENPALKGIEIKIPEPRMITIIEPEESDVIVGDQVEVEWATTGGLLSNDHVHLQLDGEPHIGSLPQNGMYTFEGVAPGPHTITANIADALHTEYTNPESMAVVNITVEAPPPDPLHRVNIGGPLVASIDSGPDWGEDSSSTASPFWVEGGPNFFNLGSGNNTGPATGGPAGVPLDLFNTERWDDPPAPELAYAFPVAAGAEIQVNVYVRELYNGVTAPGDRIFDVEVDGVVPGGLADIDPFDLGGGNQVGSVVSDTVISDGMVDIVFLHDVENPAPKAIELLLVTPAPADLVAQPTSVDFGQVATGDTATETVTLTNPLGTDGPVDVTSVAASGAPFSVGVIPPFTLNPGDTFDVDVDFDPTSTGPFSGSFNVTHNGASALSVDLDGEGVEPSPVLFRLNAGGGELAPLDTGPVWAADDGSFVSGETNTGGFANSGGSDSSVPLSTPRFDPDNVFLTERWGPASFDPMLWDFPVANGELVEVRLFMQNGWPGGSDPGDRMFDVTVEGIQILDDYDLVVDVGHQTGVMKSVIVTSDGNIDIDFAHGSANNPLVNAIEILTVDSNPSAIFGNPNPIDFGTVDVGDSGDAVVTLQNVGLAAGPSVVIDGTSFGALTNMVDDAVFPIVLYPSDTHDVTLTWSPPAPEVLGGTYFVDHNGSNDPLALSVVGEAVTPTNNDPTVDPIADQFIAELDTLSVTFGADDIDGDSLTVTQTGLPAAANVIDNLNDTFTLEWDTSLIDSGEYDVVVEVDDGNGGVVTEDLFVSVSQTLSGDIVYRVNAGGALVADTPDWTEDTTGNNSPFLVFNGNNASAPTGDTIVDTHATVPAGTPQGILNVERWSNAGLQWEFPLAEGAEAEVRLYFVETYVEADGLRQFDVAIEGVQVLDDYDIHALVGHDFAIVEDFLVTMGPGDSVLDVDFTNVADNTALKGIEIVLVNPAPAVDLDIAPGSLDFGDVGIGTPSSPQTVTYTHPGPVGTPDIEITNVSVGGANGGDFTLSTMSSVVLAPGESHGIDVTFNPGAAGPRTASLDTTETGSASGGNNVALSGTGSTNNPPAIDPIDDVQVVAGEQVDVAINSTDLDVSDTIVLGINSTPALPAGAIFTDVGDGTGSLSWPTATTDIGSYDVEITADDGTVVTTEPFSILVGQPVPLNVNAGGATTQPPGWVDEG
ncbi:MAG: choice-of-anchor D domain-containing protein, partial [Acidimicrobiia bacterium]|nr:choice-of-anchor D domain-containing protein [Acidimicrobiia bacterium]